MNFNDVKINRHIIDTKVVRYYWHCFPGTSRSQCTFPSCSPCTLDKSSPVHSISRTQSVQCRTDRWGGLSGTGHSTRGTRGWTVRWWWHRGDVGYISTWRGSGACSPEQSHPHRGWLEGFWQLPHFHIPPLAREVCFQGNFCCSNLFFYFDSVI